MYVFLSCTKSKKPYRCEAQKLYSESDLFSKGLQYARTRTEDKNIFILSAKHYVLRLTDVIGPYNRTLNDFSKEQIAKWSETAIEKMKELGIDFSKKAVFLTGKNYRELIEKQFNTIECPIDGLPMGETMHWYDKQLGTVDESLSYMLKVKFDMFKD